MKHFLSTASAALLLSTTSLTAQADPAAFVGLSYSFGGNFGLTAKILSNDKKHKGVVGAGASYYFGTTKPWGLDVGAGYTFDNAAALIGYDFLQKQPAVSAGWADIEDPAPIIVD